MHWIEIESAAVQALERHLKMFQGFIAITGGLKKEISFTFEAIRNQTLPNDSQSSAI